MHNIKEDVKNIFQTNFEYSIAHCISTDLKMSKGLAAQIKKIWRRLGSIKKFKTNGR